MSKDLELKDLGQFHGTSRYHNVLKTTVTDGIAYIMEAGYSWFVTDMLVIINMKFTKEEFLTVRLKVNQEKETAKATIGDGNGKILYSQNYEYTDAKVDEIVLFYTDNVLMLGGEY